MAGNYYEELVKNADIEGIVRFVAGAGRRGVTKAEVAAAFPMRDIDLTELLHILVKAKVLGDVFDVFAKDDRGVTYRYVPPTTGGSTERTT